MTTWIDMGRPGAWLNRERTAWQPAWPAWAIIAAVAGAIVLAPTYSRFGIAWTSFVTPAFTTLILTAAARFDRKEQPVATTLEATAQIIAFAAVGAPLSYLAASLDLQLNDHIFDIMDRALGFDWRGLLDFMNEHPWLQRPAHLVYLSFAPQATIVVLTLGFSGRLVRLRAFILAFMLTKLVTIAISAVLPAEGVWNYYGLVARDAGAMIPVSKTSWPVFFGLRDGSFSQLVASGAEGIITFPSLHAALGAIFVLALWTVPGLRWVALAVNLAMIVATPIDGSHYLVDVLAGVAIAVTAWRIATPRVVDDLKLAASE